MSVKKFERGYGFNQHYYEIAKSMLEKTVIELNYTEEIDITK